MSTNPKTEELDCQEAGDVEIKMVPVGTFAGTIEKPILVREGEPQSADTADQGGGQNWALRITGENAALLMRALCLANRKTLFGRCRRPGCAPEQQQGIESEAQA
jgi:hypothetical protein